jgi:hypothetical protein
MELGTTNWDGPYESVSISLLLVNTVEKEFD